METKKLNIKGLGFDTSLEKFKESELFSKHEDEISSIRIACDENLTYKHSYTIKSCGSDELHALWDKDGRLASLEISIHIDVEKTSEIDYLLGKLTDEYGDYDFASVDYSENACGIDMYQYGWGKFNVVSKKNGSILDVEQGEKAFLIRVSKGLGDFKFFCRFSMSIINDEVLKYIDESYEQMMDKYAKKKQENHKFYDVRKILFDFIEK